MLLLGTAVLCWRPRIESLDITAPQRIFFVLLLFFWKDHRRTGRPLNMMKFTDLGFVDYGAAVGC